MGLLGLGGQGVAVRGGLVATVCRASQASAQGQWVGRCRTSRGPGGAVPAGA